MKDTNSNSTPTTTTRASAVEWYLPPVPSSPQAESLGYDNNSDTNSVLEQNTATHNASTTKLISSHYNNNNNSSLMQTLSLYRTQPSLAVSQHPVSLSMLQQRAIRASDNNSSVPPAEIVLDENNNDKTDISEDWLETTTSDDSSDWSEGDDTNEDENNGNKEDVGQDDSSLSLSSSPVDRTSNVIAEGTTSAEEARTLVDDENTNQTNDSSQRVSLSVVVQGTARQISGTTTRTTITTEMEFESVDSSSDSETESGIFRAESDDEDDEARQFLKNQMAENGTRQSWKEGAKEDTMERDMLKYSENKEDEIARVDNKFSPGPGDGTTLSKQPNVEEERKQDVEQQQPKKTSWWESRKKKSSPTV